MDTERDVVPPSATGDSRVDQAVARLAELQETPLDEHPAVLEAVHDKLREILGELGEPGKTGGAEPGRGAQQ